MSEAIRVLKLKVSGEVAWQYHGLVLRREPNAVVLEAYFNRDDMPFLDVVLKRRDRYVETFYSDRWYNIFEIYDRDDSRLKGWYCNIARPAHISPDTVSYVDLALDLWIAPDGTQTVLDQDELEALQLAPDEHERAFGALADLQAAFRNQKPPP
jgi:uncharacterized protein